MKISELKVGDEYVHYATKDDWAATRVRVTSLDPDLRPEIRMGFWSSGTRRSEQRGVEVVMIDDPNNRYGHLPTGKKVVVRPRDLRDTWADYIAHKEAVAVERAAREDRLAKDAERAEASALKLRDALGDSIGSISRHDRGSVSLTMYPADVDWLCDMLDKARQQA